MPGYKPEAARAMRTSSPEEMPSGEDLVQLNHQVRELLEKLPSAFEGVQKAEGDLMQVKKEIAEEQTKLNDARVEVEKLQPAAKKAADEKNVAFTSWKQWHDVVSDVTDKVGNLAAFDARQAAAFSRFDSQINDLEGDIFASNAALHRQTRSGKHHTHPPSTRPPSYPFQAHPGPGVHPGVRRKS